MKLRSQAFQGTKPAARAVGIPGIHAGEDVKQAGIVRIVAQMPAEGFGERWADDMRSASAMFLEAGVGFEYLENR